MTKSQRSFNARKGYMVRELCILSDAFRRMTPNQKAFAIFDADSKVVMWRIYGAMIEDRFFHKTAVSNLLRNRRSPLGGDVVTIRMRPSLTPTRRKVPAL